MNISKFVSSQLTTNFVKLGAAATVTTTQLKLPVQKMHR